MHAERKWNGLDINTKAAALDNLPLSAKEDLLQKEIIPPFLRMVDIEPVDRSRVVTIKSGIKQLDSKIMGFDKGELSIVSGNNGSGKTSWLSQLALEAAQQGYKTIMYSGELRADRALNWLIQPAAGKDNLVRTDNPYAFATKVGVRDKVVRWLNDKVYLYNNRYSPKVEMIVPAVERCIDKVGGDLVIIDNLMSMDVTSMGSDKYDRQANVVKRLVMTAKEKNVHIIFVCHPRKSNGFLRKDDISGSADLSNAADNVYIIHRVNNDFKRTMKEMFGEANSQKFFEYDNIIEVCKNREFGVVDCMVGMYFELEGRRFLNERGEAKHYGWQPDMEPYQGEVPF